MDLSHNIVTFLAGLLAAVIVVAPLQADEKVKSRMVYCDKGQDPADVLTQELGPQRLEITLVGTCPGFTVTRDDVRIEGDDELGCPATTAKVDGTIRFSGAQRAVVACLTVTGDGDGINAGPNTSVLVVDSALTDNEGSGVFAFSGSNVSVSRSQALHNAGSGVEVITNSTADIDNTEITGNGSGDLFLSLHSAATGSGNTVGTMTLQFDSGVALDGMVGGPVFCADAESSILVNGAMLPGCSGF